MTNYLNTMLNRVKDTLTHASDSIRKSLYTSTGAHTITVQQLADYISDHKNTLTINKKLLGNTYYFNKLSMDGMNYYLEKNGDFVLQLDAYKDNHKIISYRSYKDSSSLNTPIEFPEEK